METVRVIVAAGASAVPGGLVAVLLQDRRLTVLAQVQFASGALARAKQLACDVLVLPVLAPAAESAQVMNHLRAVACPPKLLLLAEHARPDEVLAALKIGVHGYGIHRYLTPEVLCNGIVTLARHGAWMCPLTTRCLMRLAAQEWRPHPAVRPNLPKLSDHELAVLRLTGTGGKEQDIAEQLCLARTTVRTYLRRICVKLQVSSRSDALRVAVQTGLIPDRRQADRRMTDDRDLSTAS